MRSLIFVLVMAAAMAHADTPPQRIVSLNLCTDQLLFELVDQDRIRMLSQLSDDASLSWKAEQAATKPRFDGSVEKILQLKPDLVIAGSQASYGPVATLRRTGIRVEVVEMPETIEGTLALIDTIAIMVGEPNAGSTLAQQTKERLDAVRQSSAGSSERPLAAIYLPNGLSPGAGTLKHELVKLAGFRNLAAELGFDGYGTISIETLMQSSPALVIVDAADLEHASLAQQLLRHPALTASRSHNNVFAVPTPLWICAGPQIAGAAEALLQARRALDTSTSR